MAETRVVGCVRKHHPKGILSSVIRLAELPSGRIWKLPQMSGKVRRYVNIVNVVNRHFDQTKLTAIPCSWDESSVHSYTEIWKDLCALNVVLPDTNFSCCIISNSWTEERTIFDHILSADIENHKYFFYRHDICSWIVTCWIQCFTNSSQAHKLTGWSSTCLVDVDCWQCLHCVASSHSFGVASRFCR